MEIRDVEATVAANEAAQRRAEECDEVLQARAFVEARAHEEVSATGEEGDEGMGAPATKRRRGGSIGLELTKLAGLKAILATKLHELTQQVDTEAGELLKRVDAHYQATSKGLGVGGGGWVVFQFLNCFCLRISVKNSCG